MIIKVGQPRVGKTKKIKAMIEAEKGKKIIFDFNNDFPSLPYERVEFELYNPFIGEMNLDEVKVLNAGYLKTSHSLYKKAEEVLNFEGKTSMPFLVKEAIEQMHGSWEFYQNEYAKELSERMPLKIGSKQESFDALIEKIKENDALIITTKNIFSDHLRSLIFFLLYKIQQNDIDVKVFADGISNMFFKGNIKLLLEVVDLANVQMVMSSNKPSNIPSIMKDVVQEWNVYRCNDKNENQYMVKNLHIDSTIDFNNIPIGKFVTHKELV